MTLDTTAIASAFSAAFIVAAVSLCGAFVLWIRESLLERVIPLLVALAVGVLLGDAFLHLIPDAVQRMGSVSHVGLMTLAGMLLFFSVEKIVRWRHDHSIPHIDTANSAHIDNKIQPMARMNLIGDAVHNFIDGVLIAGSFAADPVLGWATTAAIVLHEIPQELGDVGALICGGYKPRRAIWLNFLCSLTVIAGVGATLLVGSLAEQSLVLLLPLAAGGFIYIAAADFIPALHQGVGRTARSGFAQVTTFAMGITIMHLIVVAEGFFTKAS